MQQAANQTVAITGANGYIGLYLTATFLANNYNVIATVRDANNQEKTKDLKSLPNSQNLKIVSLDLQKKEDFVNAFQGADSVILNASPFASNNENTEDSYVKPAVEGVDSAFYSILQNQQIKNVVFLSSMAAVCGAPGSKPDDHVFSSNDWSDTENQRQREKWYALSKTLAEQRVGIYKQQLFSKNIALTVICPTLVVGPSYKSGRWDGSLKYLDNFLTGVVQEIPQFSMSLVHAQDIADMALQGVVKRATGRYIGVSAGYTMEQIVGFLREGAGDKGQKITTKVAEGSVSKPSLFDLKSSEELLGRKFICGKQAVIDSVKVGFEKNQLII